MRMFANLLLLIGTVGLGLLLSRNLFDLIFAREGAVSFFSSAWAMQYGVLYAASATALVLGIVLAVRARRA